MTALDGERDNVTNAEQKGTQGRHADVADGDPPAVRPLFPLANCTHHMKDFLHDLIVVGIVLCDQDAGAHDSQRQSDDQIAHSGVSADQSLNTVAALGCPSTKLKTIWQSNARDTLREKWRLNGKIVLWPTYMSSHRANFIFQWPLQAVVRAMVTKLCTDEPTAQLNQLERPLQPCERQRLTTLSQCAECTNLSWL